MDVIKMWDYRVVRKESEDGSDEWYSVQEVYYDDETGKPMAQTIDLMIEGDTVTGMRTQLELMLKALKEPVLDESDITDTKNDWICEICGKDTSNVEYDYIGSGTNHLKCDLTLEDEGCGTQRLISKSSTIKDRILNLEMENAEMRDRLSELGDKMKERGL